MKVEDVAKVCHEANRAYCETQGDFSQPTWADAPQWQKDSAIAGIEFAWANPKVGPWAQHNAWCNDKVDDGWVYGEVKDPIAKTHPCLVTYDELPEFQQTKDALFQAIVKAL